MTSKCFGKITAGGALFVSCVAMISSPLYAQPNQITTSIDSRQMVELKGHLHPLARPQFDRGPVDPALRLEYVTLALRRSPAQQAELENLLVDQQNPSSGKYHKWLTPQQYADRFGASRDDLAAVSSWLTSEGLTVNDSARGRGWLVFSGTAKQVGAAFRTEIHRYMVDGKMHFANAQAPSIPAALEPAVLGLAGLDDFLPKVPRQRTPGLAGPKFTNNSGSHQLAPSDLATIYDISPLLDSGTDGSGQTIAIIGQSDVNLADLRNFRSAYSLPARDPALVLYGPDPGFTGSELEADLDLEWSGAIAPNAKLVYVYSTSASLAVLYAIDQNFAPVVSYSFSNCELEIGGSTPLIYRALAQQANAQGITWIAASGDTGAGACDSHYPGPGEPLATNGLAVNFPADIPEVTGIGGTQFNDGDGAYWSTTNRADGGSALSYIPEIAWNEGAVYGFLESTGGGASALYSKPLWQTGPGVPNDGARDVPDVSFAAAFLHDAYSICSGGSCSTRVGGTSAATPVFAGILALLNQYQVSGNLQTQAGQGNVNPRLYRLAQTSPNSFHDVTGGSNMVPCFTGTSDCVNGSFGYSAGPGYDQATGLGSIDAYNLVTGWSVAASNTTTRVSATVANIAASDSTQLTVTVTALQGNSAPGGAVTLLLGAKLLGTASLFGSGNTATGTLTIYGGQLGIGANNLVAYYQGDASFDSSSSAPFVINVRLPSGNSAVVPSVTPNPVYQQPPDANGFTFFYNIKLTEVAGTATTLTGFTIDGLAQNFEALFSNTNIAAGGSISTNLRQKAAQYPSTHIFGFTGMDASGFQWTQKLPVVFLGPELPLAISAVYNAFGHDSALIAPNTWVQIVGAGLAPAGDTRIWLASDFLNGQMPTQLDGVSATVNGKSAYVYYISGNQVNILTPPDPIQGTVLVELTNGSNTASYTVPAQTYAETFFDVVSSTGQEYVLAEHLNGTLIGPPGLFPLAPGATTPANPGETIVIAANGFGPTSSLVVSGAVTQTGSLPTLPVITIGGIPAFVSYAGSSGAPGEFQFNVQVPLTAPTGDLVILASYQGSTTQPGLLISVQAATQ